MRDDAGLLAGLGLATAAWLALVALLIVRGTKVPWFSIAYNVPITLVFAALLFHAIHAYMVLGRQRFIVAYARLGAVWIVGAILLFLRLRSKSIDVSGHMAWSVMMGVQAVAQRLPLWFISATWAVATQVLLLKLLVLGGQSGQAGLVVGALLASAVWIATRGRKDTLYGAGA
jgi:hypothetical protein